MTRDTTAPYRLTAGRLVRLGLLAAAAVATLAVAGNQAYAAQSPAVAVPPRTAISSTVAAATSAATSSAKVHGPYTMATDACAACHRAHTGSGPVLTSYPSQSQLCLSCHNGTGSAQNVAGEYSDPAIPANDPATRSFYSHDATVTLGHTLAKNDEFTGVQNRHSECTDCHNPHAATSGSASQSSPSVAWAPSGRLALVSGVSVANGQAGSDPAYTFQPSETTSLTAEYQLCFKCHSGSTVLLRNSGWTPSRYALDKAVELNPANLSFHPIEAPGTNQTVAMQNSLTDTFGTMRRWTLSTGSTVRCTSCHTGGPAVTSGTPISGDQPVHVSQNRGLLLAKYQDRVLESKSAAYDATDFALCFTCHSERPFSSNTPLGTTSFTEHRFHVAGIAPLGSGGTDIDTPGDGQGNAICSECHFRLHSTAYSVGTSPTKRLVNFSPNVLPFNGVLRFTSLPVDSSGYSHGTCTLVCHGIVHDAKDY